ncbi:MAG: IS66 family transposase, partial [Phycisphaerae bacterium]|nr:IS66 family transposase [Phycisphaerae bacterium]
MARYDARIAMLESQIAEFLAKMNTLSEQVARLSKNTSNSSQPPSSDIVKPPKSTSPSGTRKA